MGESECVALLKVLIQQRLPYRIKMTDAVRIATLVVPSEQQEKFDSFLHKRTNANATVNE